MLLISLGVKTENQAKILECVAAILGMERSQTDQKFLKEIKTSSFQLMAVKFVNHRRRSRGAETVLLLSFRT